MSVAAVNSTGAATTLQQSIHELRLNRQSCIANLILVAGYSFGLCFQIYEFNGRAREIIAIVVYFVAFILLILSGILEWTVDAFSKRLVCHGRYHANSAAWNTCISILFISAGILDIVAFVYWIRKEFDAEDIILLVSSYVLLVMAIVVLYFQLMEIRNTTWTGTILSDKADLVANVLVMIVTIMGVVLRHMEFGDFGETPDRMELATVPIWLCSSIIYTSTDALRL